MDWYSEGAPRNLSADQFRSVHRLPVTSDRKTSNGYEREQYEDRRDAAKSRQRQGIEKLGKLLNANWPAPSVSLGTALKRDYSVKKIRGKTI